MKIKLSWSCSSEGNLSTEPAEEAVDTINRELRKITVHNLPVTLEVGGTSILIGPEGRVEVSAGTAFGTFYPMRKK